MNFERRSVHFIIGQQFCQTRFGVYAHGAEFIEAERLSVFAAADLGKNGTALGIVDYYRQSNQQQQRGEQYQS